ncbi:GGDEF domain-containing response regulator [Thiohalophilus thiocyanatoxydans]|uniref:PAS domain S-box-containing protein/diguanylate cyclase (GGDEF)-like protein n=1 Tax=Thiohalophilus thiocyanatoxydans TaxID=381308 RepID=A0A4R8IVH0_9GAMM|nr:GGDEF domain-containing response regulator [Thiohalophilus thiocyanatoxydans]TDY01767.1 PAS domain S-box-containing protein/diguanylate cyclase (GGDEF)-like protein [Thiohalophilus thiocyanatoxydans]
MVFREQEDRKILYFDKSVVTLDRKKTEFGNMTAIPTAVLLIEDDPADAGLIRAALGEHGGFQVVWVTQLDDALDRLEKMCFDVVLLDLTLPDSMGIKAFDRVLQAVPDALILVLSTADNEALARSAVQHGAHDYLAKEHADAYWLPRALRYVTERKATESRLREAEQTLYDEKERNRVMLDSIGDAVLATDIYSNITYLNPIAERLTGWSCSDALGQPLAKVFNIIDGITHESARNPAQYVIEEGRNTELGMNCILISRNGVETEIEDSAAPVRDRENRVTGAVIVFHDSSQSQEFTEKMAHLAQHDFLTGLPNRMYLTENLPQMIGHASRHHKQVALLFLDLDNFKDINDLHGHAIGDRLLQSVAVRLTKRVRASDIVSRLGGDEFVIMLTEIDKPQDAACVAEMLLTELTAPFNIENKELHIRLSIGISVYPDDGDNIETLLRFADAAMYKAKADGNNKYRFFYEPGIHGRIKHRNVAISHLNIPD